MEKYIIEFENRINKKWLKENVLSLYKIERAQTFPAYQKAAEYAYNLLKTEGFEAEFVNIPADGKTVYQDARMPIGWDVNNMTLELLTDVQGIDDKLLCDYKKNPLSSVKHSVSTGSGGIKTKLVTEESFRNGTDIKGNFVLLEQSKKPSGKIIRDILDAGAIGWVSDFCENPGEAPDDTAWLNAGTETGSWHVQAEDRDFISYLITPNQGESLRRAALKDDLYVLAYSDARRYETKLPFVSALLPGKSKKEIWVTAHMYEPLIDDNPNGVIGSIAILKAIRDMISEGKTELKYSIRLIFASEFYGFAAAAEYYGGNLKEKALMGINMDGIPGSVEKGKHRSWRIFEAADYPANAASILAHFVESCATALHPEYLFATVKNSKFGDDLALADSTIGLPMTWFLRGGYNCFHHNSILSEEWLDIDVLVDSLSLSGSWILLAASLCEETICKILPECVKRTQECLNEKSKATVRKGICGDELLNFIYKREKENILSLKLWCDMPEIDQAAQKLFIPESKNVVDIVNGEWYNKSKDYVFKRITRGLPMDMTRIKAIHKQELRGLFIYFPIAELLSRMDGEKTFAQIINEYEWSTGNFISDESIKKYLDICNTLTQSGYLEKIN